MNLEELWIYIVTLCYNPSPEMVNLLSHLYKQNHLDKLSTVTMTKQNNIDLNLDINISPKLILQFFKATS